MKRIPGEVHWHPVALAATGAALAFGVTVAANLMPNGVALGFAIGVGVWLAYLTGLYVGATPIRWLRWEAVVMHVITHAPEAWHNSFSIRDATGLRLEQSQVILWRLAKLGRVEARPVPEGTYATQHAREFRLNASYRAAIRLTHIAGDE